MIVAPNRKRLAVRDVKQTVSLRWSLPLNLNGSQPPQTNSLLYGSFFGLASNASRARTAETDGRVVLMHDMVVLRPQSCPPARLLQLFYKHLAIPGFVFLFGPQLANTKAPRQSDWALNGEQAAMGAKWDQN
jgi:hypothetical protein